MTMAAAHPPVEEIAERVTEAADMVTVALDQLLPRGEGAEQRAPMARAVIGGLITSTLLTLFVVPIVYTLLDDLTGWLGVRWKARSPHRRSPVPALTDADIRTTA